MALEFKVLSYGEYPLCSACIGGREYYNKILASFLIRSWGSDLFHLLGLHPGRSGKLKQVSHCAPKERGTVPEPQE